MGLGEVAIATLPSVIFPKLMFSDGLGGKRNIMYIFANENYTNKRFIDIKLFLS